MAIGAEGSVLVLDLVVSWMVRAFHHVELSMSGSSPTDPTSSRRSVCKTANVRDIAWDGCVAIGAEGFGLGLGFH